MPDITLGQYYQTDSILHRLDARIKLIGTFIYLVSLFIANNTFGFLFAALFLVIMMALSRVPLSFILRGLKPVFVLLVITMLFNALLTPGHAIFRAGPLSVTREGVSFAVMMGFRLTLLVLGSAIMTLTTTPSGLTGAIEGVMKPLKFIGVPVANIAMMMSIALRFIPILAEEADRIMMAQKARGADFDSGNIIARARGLVPLMIPLFVSAFRRASDLALAMDARCYNDGKGRTRLNPMVMKNRDYIALAVLLTYLLIVLMIRRYTA